MQRASGPNALRHEQAVVAVATGGVNSNITRPKHLCVRASGSSEALVAAGSKSQRTLAESVRTPTCAHTICAAVVSRAPCVDNNSIKLGTWGAACCCCCSVCGCCELRSRCCWAVFAADAPAAADDLATNKRCWHVLCAARRLFLLSRRCCAANISAQI